MALPITLFYASFFALFALVLSFGAGGARGKTGISILYGDPANMGLAEKIRKHQNFLEYVPMFLIVFALLEANGAPSLLLYICGDVLIITRIAHAVGLKHDDMGTKGRFIGAAGTALTTLVISVYGLWLGGREIFERLTGG